MLNKKYGGLIFGFLVLVFFNLINYFKDPAFFISQESYFHLARYFYLDNLFYYFLSETLFDRIFVLILGLLFLVFLNLILIRLKFEEDVVFYSIILVSLSPFFIYMYSSILPFSLAAVLVLIHIFLSLRNHYVSLFFIPLLFYSSYVLGLFYFALFLAFGFVRLKRSFFYWTSLVFILSSVLFLFFVSVYYYQIQSFFSIFLEVGSLYSVTLGLFILGIGGIYMGWKRTLNHNLLILFFVLSFILSFIFREIFVFFGVLLAIYSGYCINFFVKRHWNISAIKSFFLVTVFCVFIFSSISFNYLSSQSLDIDSMNYFSSIESSSILSIPDNGFAIGYFSNGYAFLDSFSFMFNGFDDLDSDLETMLFSRDLQEVTYLFNYYNISHVYVDEYMINRVWSSRNDGLLFLFNTQRFERVYQSDKGSIYEFISS